jgi:hypothetical protein
MEFTKHFIFAHHSNYYIDYNNQANTSKFKLKYLLFVFRIHD